MADHLEVCGTSATKSAIKNERCSYDRNFKLIVIKFAETTNNCAAARKYGVTEANVRRWRQQKLKLQDAKLTRKTFRGPKRGHFPEVDRQVVEFIINV